jgi:hypothetical protein
VHDLPGNPLTQTAATLRAPQVTVGSRDRYALAVIRITNGATALVTPSIIIKLFGEDSSQSAAATYGLQVFSIRENLIQSKHSYA